MATMTMVQTIMTLVLPSEYVEEVVQNMDAQVAALKGLVGVHTFTQDMDEITADTVEKYEKLWMSKEEAVKILSEND